jgi:aspartyl-tRNA(Asn)/glutamyl-tRNA(Gln) amidotransferase subunit C
MPLTLEEVRNIALLARLRLTPEEERRFANQLSAVLEYADRLRRVDTTGIPPTASVLGSIAPLRADAVRVSPSPAEARQRLLMNAPSVDGGMIRVPSVLDPS